MCPSVKSHDPPDLPIVPSAEAWAALSPEERHEFLLSVQEALQREAELTPEGRPHSFAKMSAATVLGDFFERLGRPIYLACELPVLYPGEAPFAPDLIAVVGVEDPGPADTREGWVVVDEGRGPDLILEILYKGDRDKDLVTNVARYARLEVPEYFVYDRRRQRLYGYRLGGAGRYVSIPPRGDQLRSTVLGLDLGIEDGQLHFYIGGAQVPETRQLLSRLERLMGDHQDMLVQRDRQLQAESAARQEAEARAEAEAAARRVAEARAALEATRAEHEAARAELEAATRRAIEAELAALRAKLGER